MEGAADVVARCAALLRVLHGDFDGQIELVADIVPRVRRWLRARRIGTGETALIDVQVALQRLRCGAWMSRAPYICGFVRLGGVLPPPMTDRARRAVLSACFREAQDTRRRMERGRAKSTSMLLADRLLARALRRRYGRGGGGSFAQFLVHRQ
jgi:hypothetical protein